jgi:threonine synthase
MYACPHTAVALAVIEKLAKQGVIKASEKVVCVSTAHGLKFTEFKVRYHESQLDGIESKLANPPVYLPADHGHVVDAISKHFS